MTTRDDEDCPACGGTGRDGGSSAPCPVCLARSTKPGSGGAGALPSADQAEKRANALLVVHRAEAPSRIESNGWIGDWALYGPALVARCAYLLGSIFVLKARDVDANVLARSLYEHAIAFAWIAIDPAEHTPRMISEEFRLRLRSDEEASDFDGVSILPPEVRREFEDYRREYRSRPSVRQMASESDAYWAPRLPESGIGVGRRSLVATYTILFRNFSQYTHPTSAGLDRFISPAEPGWFEIGIRAPDRDQTSLTIGPLVFGQLLLMSACALGWPSARAVHAVFERYALTAEANDAP